MNDSDDLEKFRFDLYRSQSLSLRIELTNIERTIDELLKRAKICDARLNYYEKQLVFLKIKGFSYNEPSNQIEKVAS